jgi:hypothetical protein
MQEHRSTSTHASCLAHWCAFKGGERNHPLIFPFECKLQLRQLNDFRMEEPSCAFVQIVDDVTLSR